MATESPDPFESLESVNFEPAGAAGNTSDGLPQLPTRQPSSEVGSTRNGTPDVDAEGRFEQVDDPFGDAAGGVALPSLRISGLTDDPFADSPGSDGNPLQPYADDEWEDRPAEDRAEDLAEEAGADVARSMSMRRQPRRWPRSPVGTVPTATRTGAPRGVTSRTTAVVPRCSGSSGPCDRAQPAGRACRVRAEKVVVRYPSHEREWWLDEERQ